MRTSPLLMLLIGLLAACGTPDAPAPDAAAPALTPGELVAVDRPAPDFSMETLDGAVFSMAEQQGKVVLVNFWATWCGPCIVEMPDLVAIHEAWEDRGFTVLGVSQDIEGAEVIAPFVAEHGITFPIVMDPDNTLGEAFGGIYALPTTFVIDPEGNIMGRFMGIFPIEEMRPELEAMLQAPAT